MDKQTTNIYDYHRMPPGPRAATKWLMDYLLQRMCPLIQRIRLKLLALPEDKIDEDINKIREVFLLSCNQIKKCMMNALEIFKMEIKNNVLIKESRIFTYKRITWCISKHETISNYLDKLNSSGTTKVRLPEDMLATSMYFVNWIDYTFDNLTKLAFSIYRTDYKDSQKLLQLWKKDMIEHTTSLHMCIDELLLSAMTLCKYCLEEDQLVLKARCHVVLRETKALFLELLNVDITDVVSITPEELKLPIMPSNINILIDVLKDALYLLETNTNTALLSLLIHCYVYCDLPVDVLRDHFRQRRDHFCPCNFGNEDEIDIETCKDVKEFDLYNERLAQIGSFAVSCSSDQKRILALQSCLSSLESLDTHLVPAISNNALDYHTSLLANFWKQEVTEIRDTVFLIVDPAAFIERCQQYMRQLYVEKEMQEPYVDDNLWNVIINIGSIVYDFFAVYKKHEPDALIQNAELDCLLNNLKYVQKECKLVSTLIKTTDTYFSSSSNQAKPTAKNISKRVRLLYSLVKKIKVLLHPKDEFELFDYDLCDDEVPLNKNETHTITNPVYSKKKTGTNLTRSFITRNTTMERTNRAQFLSKVCDIKLKKNHKLNWSAQVSELFKIDEKIFDQIPAATSEETSYKTTSVCQTRSFPFMRKLNSTFDVDNLQMEQYSDNNLNAIDTSLGVTEILQNINDVTKEISFIATQGFSVGRLRDDNLNRTSDSLDSASVSTSLNISPPSDMSTWERIGDIDFVESKLSELKTQSQKKK